MERKDVLNDLIADLNRRKRAIEALRLLLEDDDVDTALTMSVRLKADLDSIVTRLRALTGEADSASAGSDAPVTDAAPRVPRASGHLGDAQEAAGFELWVETIIDAFWNALSHPVRTFRKFRFNRGMATFVAALALASFTGWQAYQKTFLSRHGLVGEYFLDESFKTLFVRRQDSNINFRWLRRPPMRNFRAENFSVRWTGFVKVTQPGAHEFYTISDDGVRLWVNDQVLIENWGIHGGTLDKGDITLTAGYHRVMLEYFQGEGDSVIKLQWKQPGDNGKTDIPARALFPRLPEG